MANEPEPAQSGLRVAALVKSGENQTSAIECAPGILETRGTGNRYLLTTAEGDVLVNAGTLADARRGRACMKTGLSDPDIDSRRAGLEILIRDHHNADVLTERGGGMTKSRYVDALATRMQVDDYLRRHLDITKTSIK